MVDGDWVTWMYDLRHRSSDSTILHLLLSSRVSRIFFVLCLFSSDPIIPYSDTLPQLDFKLTWALLIFSGFFFTLGSIAFVRAFEEPPKRPIFYWYKHCQTDELLGAWLFLVGTIPAVPCKHSQ